MDSKTGEQKDRKVWELKNISRGGEHRSRKWHIPVKDKLDLE